MLKNKALISALFCSILLVACSSTGSLDGSDGAGGQSGDGTTSGVAGGSAGDLSKRSVYFDFDKFNVKAEYKPVVQAHANQVKKDKRKVVIQGNADERGSREYNLALGQRRAASVRKTMSLMGVSSKRIEVVSYGEEKPKAKGHDEASWAENRRADIVY
ncbi:MAG: peptidoglycan-associated lipoprotein Pal [Oxalobacter sp.]|nr:MAG: peptidoglycan-associated lipoprotein Pal [Oxalobacter sp.]